MITAVDTCVLVDVLGPDPMHGQASREAMRQCMRDGTVVACEVVWAEVLTYGGERAGMIVESLSELGLGFSPMGMEATSRAAECWRSYRRKGGRRDRIAADFLIGGHALAQCDRLLTRDADFFGRHFEALRLAPHPGCKGSR